MDFILFLVSTDGCIWCELDYKESDFPRFKYHLNLVKKLIDHKDKVTGIKSQCQPALKSSILIYGKSNEARKKLFDPLSIIPFPRKGNFIYIHIISSSS